MRTRLHAMAMGLVLAGSAVLVMSLDHAADAPAGPPQVGQPAPAFTLEDQNGKSVSLSDLKDKIVVLEWINPACPFVVRHYREGTMTGLASKYADKVVWVAINSTAGAGNDLNKRWTDQHKLGYAILNDSAGAVGQAYGATNTPNMFIIDAKARIVYKGAIDDDPRGNKPDRVNYVDQALTELLADKPVSTPETKAYGCTVKYAK
jgi:peroxiredoxin